MDTVITAIIFIVVLAVLLGGIPAVMHFMTRHEKDALRSGTFDMQSCPNCHKNSVFEAESYWEHRNRLSLKGQKFKLTLLKRSSFDVSPQTFCCISCGYVWAKANLDEIRKVVSEFGTEEMKRLISL